MRNLVTLGVCLIIAGCGAAAEYEGPQRFPLSGKVTFNGEPVDGGVIAFVPDGENLRPTGGPIVGGQYSIPAAQGANAGQYRVEIRWSRPTGKQIQDTADTGGMVDEVKQVIPKKFNTESATTVTVSAGETVFDYDLSDK